MLSQWLYPWLRDGEGPKAAGRMFSHLSGSPLQILQSLDWSGGSQYLLLLCLPCIWLWRRRSLPTLLIALPQSPEARRPDRRPSWEYLAPDARADLRLDLEPLARELRCVGGSAGHWF